MLPRVRLGFLLLFVLIVAADGLIGAPAHAQDERVTVRVDGRSVFRVGPAGEDDSGTRARRIERRLATLLENPNSIAPARVESPSTDVTSRIISVAGVPVVTVTEEDAQDNLIDVDALATQWAQAIDAALQRGRERRVSAWGQFTTEIQASVETSFSRLTESAIRVIPRALASLLVIILFGLVAAFVRWLMRVIFRRIVDDLTTENLIKQVAYYSVWALGILVAADALGFDPQTVVAGLGLTGLALGFALRDIISNFISGLLILVLRPFKLGDQIVVSETEGSVERIDLRATQIRTYDGRLVHVPNSELFTSRVTNNTASPVRRGSVRLFVDYSTDLKQLTAVLGSAIYEAEGVLQEPPASVRVRELGQDDIVVEARFWTDSRRSDYLATTSAVGHSIVEALRQAGINLPEPDMRVVELRSPDKWRDALGNRGSMDIATPNEPKRIDISDN